MRKRFDDPATTHLSDAVAELVADAAARREPERSPATMVGRCVATTHPTLVGRVEIEWSHGREQRRAWLTGLLGLGVRVDDRVLLQQPLEWPEPVITGVLDGFAERPPVSSRPGSVTQLGRGEHVCVYDSRGAEVVRIVDGEDGPVVRLLQGDVALEIDGRLRIRAHEIRLEAERGSVEIEASHDIRLHGEVIHLN